MQRAIGELQQTIERVSRYIEAQEDQLVQKQREIEALQTRIQQGIGAERLALEAEIAEEQEGYELLKQAIVKQRHMLEEYEELLRQYQSAS
ncbi:MAG: hypothetical protein AB4426_33745 [Xenococcaceae cyanobacterium]